MFLHEVFGAAREWRALNLKETIVGVVGSLLELLLREESGY